MIGGWATNIQSAAGVLQGMIFTNGLSTVSLLYGGQAGAYCQGSTCASKKAGIVISKLQALGGDPNSLQSPCYFESGNYYEKQ